MHTRKSALIPAIATACLFAGCADSEIKTYRVAKEERPPLPQVTAAAAGGGAHNHGGGLPHVHGTVPAGWVEQPPERMRVASFQIRGDGGRLAQMAIIPLPGTTGIELQSINMWREELGLPEFSSEQYKNDGKSIDVGNVKGTFFEMQAQSARPGEEFKRGTLGAVFEREGVLWFAKMTGEGTLVSEQKDNFQSYLKSLEFHEAGAHDEPHTAAAPSGGGPTPKSSEQPVSANTGQLPADSNLPRWNPPSNWQEKPPGPMLTAAYSVTGADGSAEVTISKLSGDGGGMIPNVNRWRGQLSLQPASPEELQKSISMLEVDGKKDTYVADIKGTNSKTGKPARMIAAGVPRGGETWFYKLMGDEAAVAKEKAAFEKFITSAY